MDLRCRVLWAAGWGRGTGGEARTHHIASVLALYLVSSSPCQLECSQRHTSSWSLCLDPGFPAVAAISEPLEDIPDKLGIFGLWLLARPPRPVFLLHWAPRRVAT